MTRCSPPVALLLLAGALLPPAHAQDPTQTDGDKYRTVLDSVCARFLEYRDRPGEKTHPHHHPAFALIALSPFKRTLTLPDGKVLAREFKPGDVMWSPAQSHIGENVGSTPTHVMIIEMKPAMASHPECTAQ